MLLNDKISALQNLIKRKITNAEVAKVLGLGSGQAVQNRISRKQALKDYEVVALDEYFLNNANKANQNNSGDSVDIDYFTDVFGSCGSGTFVLSEKTEKINVPKKLLLNYSKTKQYSVINAYGDSMYPYIQDKDLLIVEHFGQGEQIRDNRVYVFRYGENIFVKRLVLNVNQIIIKSDNKEYSPITIKADDDFQVIGRIIGLMRSAE